jgi:hypothetical protein
MSADQFALIRPHPRNQPTHTLADVNEFLDSVLSDLGAALLVLIGSTQPAISPVLPIVVVQGRARDRIEPGIQLFCVAQLILAIHDPQAEVLQNIFGLSQIAQAFDEKLRNIWRFAASTSTEGSTFMRSLPGIWSLTLNCPAPT